MYCHGQIIDAPCFRLPSLEPRQRFLPVVPGHAAPDVLVRVLRERARLALGGVETRELVRAVRRNRARFPVDFMFRLNRREFDNLRSRCGTSSAWGGRRHLPYAFTEQGVAMLSRVLRSPRAVRVNIEIMRGSSGSAMWSSRTPNSRRRSIGLRLMTPPPASRKWIGYLRSSR